ncbi:beta-ketoacyl synthase N-terminal-like domain-containing protein [Aureisphaera galaxeae]|uniref:beta-ketoacyl synthase N-terminal-like domain-containing protein n=1 Tax=Aureisphaera galaxeae TaxID=1538023 RepID=UPI00234FFC16|nr:beta-ketoacyl synthase N-terminal-like domain-containing protein [Aureisphaera galaxeae]MDC8002695.1 beta-ketoacyl synthase N-terminal-like domain-containing protein [Aureisphaera galaxeae]
MLKLSKILQQPISITGIASVSALGMSLPQVWECYKRSDSIFTTKSVSGQRVALSKVTPEIEEALSELKQSHSAYKKLDRSVLLGILAARMAFPKHLKDKLVGVTIGSSRGATGLFEKYHEQFRSKGKVSAFSSPTTTLGNISSWVGQDLGVQGIQVGHSVTCSTALHAVLNGIAWLQADMADAFVVGGSEAALTPFTLAQMQAMKLYSTSPEAFACESLRLDKKKNTMVLGEGAAVAVLEKGISENRIASIKGYGFASEKIAHGSAISENAECFQESMKNALDRSGLKTVDAIIMHAPGTVKGDTAEFNAVKEVFRNKLPLLTTNKWLLGHTFGASGMMSVEMAILMLQHNQFIPNPFFSNNIPTNKPLEHLMVNAVGFGGNAVSIIVGK